MTEIRLIDANALRERVNRTIDYAVDEFDKGYNIGIQKAVELIDNAPTINAVPMELHEKCMDKAVSDYIECQENKITDEDIQNAIKQGYNDGYAMAKAKFERPQGEWEHISDDTNKQRVIYKCSVCGRIIDVYYREDLAFSYPFCHCGADMRGGGGDD